MFVNILKWKIIIFNSHTLIVIYSVFNINSYKDKTIKQQKTQILTIKNKCMCLCIYGVVYSFY